MRDFHSEPWSLFSNTFPPNLHISIMQISLSLLKTYLGFLVFAKRNPLYYTFSFIPNTSNTSLKICFNLLKPPRSCSYLSSTNFYKIKLLDTLRFTFYLLSFSAYIIKNACLFFLPPISNFCTLMEKDVLALKQQYE